ncbi:DUF4129 domain-containing protein [Marichromatium bheemlicum]|uniref:DUF4129 domain-containing protein n=1 Tax=Marichromatium bheemlicum TaxID=365339 RepID=A0ABX1I864_9GAMM|nr:DUF4129 domain-containing protein [Marichromatium bheemlicum]NKN32936.1 DUF4129 domain-containing protein [Marichromatium bheemlicum]
MRLERLTARLRPCPAWQAIDLGFALARAWFPALWALWWCTALPLTLMVLALAWLHSDLWLLALWWCKPIYEAPLLLWASRALFDERPRRGALPGMLGAGLRPRLLPLLLWRRLSPRRALVLPLLLLEGLPGRAHRARLRTLAEGSASGWLTLVCYHLEAILWGGMLLGLYLLIPEGLAGIDLVAALDDSASPAYWISSACYLLACSLIAPFYVCAGFALYLTRRTELEGWDIELAFRRAPPPPAAVLPALALLAPLLLAPPPAEAETWPDPEAARARIAEVLDSPEFGTTREVELWLPVTDPAQRGTEDAEDSWAATPPPWLAGTIQWGLVTLAAIALLVLVRALWRERAPRLPRSTRTGHEAASGPHATSPLDHESEIRRLLDADDPGAAIGALYRASLERLDRLGLSLPPGATEGSCVQRASARLPRRIRVPFAAIAAARRHAAYGDRAPSAAHVERLLSHWRRWRGRTGAH